MTCEDEWFLNDFSFGSYRYPDVLAHVAVPLHTCNVQLDKQLSTVNDTIYLS